jgi:hypothetical protein
MLAVAFWARGRWLVSTYRISRGLYLPLRYLYLVSAYLPASYQAIADSSPNTQDLPSVLFFTLAPLRGINPRIKIPNGDFP